MRRSIYKITTIYFIFSVLWIKFSDKILFSALKHDSIFLTTIQTYKGIFFVVVSTLIIFLFLIKDAKKLEILNEEKNKHDLLIKHILTNSNSHVSVRDLNGVYNVINRAALKFHNKTENEVVGKSINELYSPHEAEEVLNQDKKVLEAGIPIDFEKEIVHTDGGKVVFNISKFPLRDDNGKIYSIGAIAKDITAQKNYYERLKIEAEIFKNLRQGIILTDKSMNILEINASIIEIFKYKREELINENIKKILFSYSDLEKRINGLKENEHALEGELFLRKSDETYFPARFSMSNVRNFDNEIEKYIILIEDLTDLKNREKEIYDLMYKDPITGLKNQDAFHKHLQEVINYSEKYKGKFAVIHLDINGLKSINRSLGHKAGNAVLKSVSDKLSIFIDKDMEIGKLNGDEFAIIIFEKIKIFELKIFAQEILNIFKKPLKIHGKDIYVGLNIGISVYPNDGQDVDLLMKNATTALQSSKKNGKNKMEFFSDSFNTDLDKKFELSCDLPKAIEHKEFILHYQPQFNVKNNKIVGMEALVRWNHPKHGIIYPKEFIHIAEETGEIIELGEFVIEKACEQFKAFLNKGYSLERMSVNLSPVQFKKHDIVENVIDILDKVGLSHNYLDLEITENVLIDDISGTENKLKNFKNKGITISLDDFGTGYSSLSYLKSFSLERLKIDREFIKDIPNKDNENLSRSIASLGKSLGLKVLAEGVETEYQYKFVKELGIEEVQGYYLAKPMDSLELEKFIEIYSNK